MAKVWKISDAAAIAFHAITMLAALEGRMLTTRQIANVLKVSEAHLSKVLQRLTKAGLVAATRGPKGGFKLARPSEEINLLEVYEAIEGPLIPTKCLLGKPVCDGQNCIMGNLMDDINNLAGDYLSGTKLSQLVKVYDGIEEALDAANDPMKKSNRQDAKTPR